MPTSSQYVILTAQGLQVQVKSPTENDCACIEDGRTLRQDCTCVEDGRMLVSNGQRETAHYQQGALHIIELAGGYRLAFNPLADIDVVVLNPAAHELLRAFRNPRPLQGRVAHLADEQPGVTEAAGRLVELGLLQACHQPTPVLQPQAAHTLTAWLHVTNACNLRCTYCYVSKDEEQMDEAVGRQAIEAIVRSAQRHGMKGIRLKYAGGEASLNLSLITTLHTYAQTLAEDNNLDLAGVVLSNGVGWGERKIAALQRLGLELMISLDGVRAYHDKQRPFIGGRGSFQAVEHSLDRLQALGVIPSISITISNQSAPGLAETVAYLLARRLPFTFNFYRETSQADASADLALQDARIITGVKAALAVIEQNLPPYNLVDTLLDLTRLDALHEHTCGVGHSYMVINHHGGVAKCHMHLADTVADVTADDPLQLIRLDTIGIQNLPVTEKAGCRDCEWRYWCAGGCPALTYRVMGRFDVKSPNCRIYKALFPEILRLEGLRILRYSGHLTA